ncbi:MAG: two-component system, response regulator PdtaR [Clostridia bacterium]|nr:response regulator receiver/ANTAR protein [Clostridiales bacterium]MDK2984703.1 two-component system, response regulator PdtaR [Clostridia bacterium]
MRRTEIYIVTGDQELLQNIKNILSFEGYVVTGSATHASQVLREIRTIKTDLILVDSNLQGIKGLELIEIIAELSIPIIVITDRWQKELATITQKRIIQTTIVKPVIPANLLPAIETALATNAEVNKLKNEVDFLKEKLEARKVVEKAKGILMENMELTEEEAYKLIRTQSMKRSKTMKEVAQAIITSSSLFKKK